MNERIKNYALKQLDTCIANDTIDAELYRKLGVNSGLRDVNGKGVLTGLTNISSIISFKHENGESIPCDGELWYRGYKIDELISSLDGKFGFEKTAYLLLFGEKPDKEQEKEFTKLLSDCRTLPTNFTRDVIMKAASKDIMNSMTRSILTLASYDPDVTSGRLEDSIRQCIQLISQFPLMAVYAYHAYNHYENNASMYIHRPVPEYSTAENFLHMLRPDGKFTELEAKVLDIALMLHMEHGGGNNSTFTTRVVTSSGSDTYSAISAAMSSLKGPKHGGANIKVVEMMNDIRANVADITDRQQVADYLRRIVDKQAFDGKGLIYGMGHAIYSVSDPRERELRVYAEQLAATKGKSADRELYKIVEEEAPKVIAEKRKIYKGVSSNVDFYSGFIYEMLEIPAELYTPLFAIARIVGWSAHRIEELICMNKIIRPAYLSVREANEM